MKYGETASVLKPLSELNLPDPRIELEWYRPYANLALTAADIRERLERYASLLSSVPERVKTRFDVARNLMLYAYFVFEFQTQAELQAYATLEFALRERLGNPTRKVKRGKESKIVPLMLRELLLKSIKDKLIIPEQLPAWDWDNKRQEHFDKVFGQTSEQISAEAWLESVVQNIIVARNSIAHGDPHLDLPHSFNQIERCADIINALFQNSANEESSSSSTNSPSQPAT